jgi:hypothetical protein
MPRRNRVTPWGALVATAARGDVMGNRGVLHDVHGNIVRNHQGQRWIICRLHFKSRRREIMQPGRYTELFFLDEATALAAGHRPCAECMRTRYDAYRHAWMRAHPRSGRENLPSAQTIDAALHAARLAAHGDRHTWIIRAAEVPDGAMVCRASNEPVYAEPVYLRWHGQWLRWSFTGYLPHGSAEISPFEPLCLLTPQPTIDALRSGYTPCVHASALLP